MRLMSLVTERICLKGEDKDLHFEIYLVMQEELK